jgi:hypothetical protein
LASINVRNSIKGTKKLTLQACVTHSCKPLLELLAMQ